MTIDDSRKVYTLISSCKYMHACLSAAIPGLILFIFIFDNSSFRAATDARQRKRRCAGFDTAAVPSAKLQAVETLPCDKAKSLQGERCAHRKSPRRLLLLFVFFFPRYVPNTLQSPFCFFLLASSFHMAKYLPT